MEKKIENDLTIADALLRIKAIENLLVSKNILTKEEIHKEYLAVSHVILKEILAKANVTGDLDKLVNDLQSAM